MNSLFVFFFAVIATSLANPQDALAPILKQSQDVRPDGYDWSYETGNGISAAEQGYLKDADTLVAQGYAQWPTPDGQFIQLTYVADENGFQPKGDHLPTPPPVPKEIARALEWIRTHPEPEQKTYQ